MCVISVNPLLILKIKILPEIQEFLCCLVIKSAYNLMCPFQELCGRFAQILFIRSHSSILPASHKTIFSSDLMTSAYQCFPHSFHQTDTQEGFGKCSILSAKFGGEKESGSCAFVIVAFPLGIATAAFISSR